MSLYFRKRFFMSGAYIGFVITSSIPALMPSCWYRSWACPVTPMIKGYSSRFIFRTFLKWSRICLVLSIPFIIGILKSVKMILYDIPLSYASIILDSCSYPLIHVSTLCFKFIPINSRMTFIDSKQKLSSSVIKILLRRILFEILIRPNVFIFCMLRAEPPNPKVFRICWLSKFELLGLSWLRF